MHASVLLMYNKRELSRSEFFVHGFCCFSVHVGTIMELLNKVQDM